MDERNGKRCKVAEKLHSIEVDYLSEKLIRAEEEATKEMIYELLKI